MRGHDTQAGARAREDRLNGQAPEARPSGAAGSRGVAPRSTRGVVRKVRVGSVFKVSMVFYAAVYCILLVAAVLLWLAATATGLRENIEKVIADLIASGKFHFVGWELFRAGTVGGAVLVVLGTTANVLLAVLYNLISDLVGGVSIVVEERPVTRAVRKRALRSAQPPRSPQPPRVAEEPPRSVQPPRVAEEPPRVAEEPRPAEAPVPARASKILIPEVERRQARQPVPAPTPTPAQQPVIPEHQLSGAERATDTNLEAFGL